MVVWSAQFIKGHVKRSLHQAQEDLRLPAIQGVEMECPTYEAPVFTWCTVVYLQSPYLYRCALASAVPQQHRRVVLQPRQLEPLPIPTPFLPHSPSDCCGPVALMLGPSEQLSSTLEGCQPSVCTLEGKQISGVLENHTNIFV
ncbi:hypothetical protein E2C01_003554 [Portunus trituberculatus]|uniref:Uncharacterized protein n=1 Tax=Portunus trituberculatus TaxID=210409 RepID=A0A5B7CN35_PORTR|nr:hypothetical protein [Portunus trituberculatus]